MHEFDTKNHFKRTLSVQIILLETVSSMSARSCTKYLPYGKYLVIVEQDVQQCGVFNMDNTYNCENPDVICCNGMSPHAMTEQTMGVYRAITVAYMLIICGQEKGFVVRSGLIHETKSNGKKIHGLVVGPLGDMSRIQENKMMHCLKNDIGFVTEGMWYMCEKTAEEESSV